MIEDHTTSPWGRPAEAYQAPTATATATSVADPVLRPGPRVAARPVRYYTPPGRVRSVLRKVRATAGLAVIAVGLGFAVACSLGAIVWLVATAIHHAASS